MAKRQPRDLSGLIDLKDQKERKAGQPAPKKATGQKVTGAGDERKIASWRVKTKAKKQFAILAMELDMKEQDLLAEAMNMVFKKYGKDPIA